MAIHKAVWDACYENGENWGSVGVSDYVQDVARKLAPGASVLDIGCGTGRNAIYLADRGFNVEAFDVSSSAIKVLREIIGMRRKSNLSFYQADFHYWERAARFDFVILHGVLNSIERERQPELLKHLRKRITYGGLIFISIFHPLPSEVALHGVSVLSDIDSDFVQHKAFHGYTTERHDIRVFSHKHGALAEHTHCIERFLLRKPESSSVCPSPV